MYVLGIETTCDETACAIVKDGKQILSNVLLSQIPLHKKFGGVYPELASRSHVDHLLPMVRLAIEESGISEKEIDLIAVAHAPGLVGSIVIGLNAAKALSIAWDIPFVAVNHVEAHLYAAMMGDVGNIKFPAIGVVLSGGHTFIVKVHALGHYELLGTTVDDAIGEAFDKVGLLLDLPYPGGPEIEKLALKGSPDVFPLKPGFVKGKPLHFSFSGIKTNVLYTLKGSSDKGKTQLNLTEQQKQDMAASFQYHVFKDVIKKTLLAADLHGCKQLFLGGGVTQSKTLRNMFKESTDESMEIFYPPAGLSLDNGAMIAGLGYHIYQKNPSSHPLDIEALPRLPL